MITETSTEILAPSSLVWDVYTDVQRWPDWTASVERVVPLDGADLAVGRRFRIKQPRFPELVWEVSELDPGRSWTWRQRSPGGLTLGIHEVTALAGDRTLVRLGVDQRGPIGVVVGVLMRRLTRRYLRLEAQGLESRCESSVATNPGGTSPR